MGQLVQPATSGKRGDWRKGLLLTSCTYRTESQISSVKDDTKSNASYASISPNKTRDTRIQSIEHAHMDECVRQVRAHDINQQHISLGQSSSGLNGHHRTIKSELRISAL